MGKPGLGLLRFYHYWQEGRVMAALTELQSGWQHASDAGVSGFVSMCRNLDQQHPKIRLETLHIWPALSMDGFTGFKRPFSLRT
jgi:hypothetical protein